MYETIKIIHILSWTSWMAGMFYLPRIFVYHAENGIENQHTATTFKTMERKLFYYIMKPAMIATWITGIYLAISLDMITAFPDFWFLFKLIFVIFLTFQHYLLGRWISDFATDTNRRSGKFYRVANEIPTLLFIGIVIMIIARPF